MRRSLLCGAALLALFGTTRHAAAADELPHRPVPPGVIVFSSLVALGGTSVISGAALFGYGDYLQYTSAPNAPTVMDFTHVRDRGSDIQGAGGAMIFAGALITIVGSIGLAFQVPKWKKVALGMQPTSTGSRLGWTF